VGEETVRKNDGEIVKVKRKLKMGDAFNNPIHEHKEGNSQRVHSAVGGRDCEKIGDCAW